MRLVQLAEKMYEDFRTSGSAFGAMLPIWHQASDSLQREFERMAETAVQFSPRISAMDRNWRFKPHGNPYGKQATRSASVPKRRLPDMHTLDAARKVKNV